MLLNKIPNFHFIQTSSIGQLHTFSTINYLQELEDYTTEP